MSTQRKEAEVLSHRYTWQDVSPEKFHSIQYTSNSNRWQTPRKAHPHSRDPRSTSFKRSLKFRYHVPTILSSCEDKILCSTIATKQRSNVLDTMSFIFETRISNRNTGWDLLSRVVCDFSMRKKCVSISYSRTNSPHHMHVEARYGKNVSRQRVRYYIKFNSNAHVKSSKVEEDDKR